MYVTRDYLKTTPWESIIDMINDACFTQLFPGSTKLKEFESLGGTKTRIVISFNRSKASGNLLPEVALDTYTYDRLDLTSFFHQVQVLEVGDVRLPYSSVRITELLSELNDIIFDMDDFEHVEYNSFDQEFILKANKDSLRFVGFLRIKLVNTLKADLSSFSLTEFPDLGKPDNIAKGDINLINGTYYITGYDFTEHREYLRHQTKDSVFPDPKRMASILSAVTNKPWTVEKVPTPHNIAYMEDFGVLRFKVIYNGPVLPRYSLRRDIQNVLVIALNETLCPDVLGEIRIHYN